MKIRIKGNTVRFRLSRPEVEEFGKSGEIEVRTEFTPAPFIYVLKSSSTLNGLSASFENNTITLLVPASWIEEWVTTNRTGFEGTMPTENGNQIYLLLEKDFKCLDNTIEDQVDNYENPLTIQL